MTTSASSAADGPCAPRSTVAATAPAPTSPGRSPQPRKSHESDEGSVVPPGAGRAVAGIIEEKDARVRDVDSDDGNAGASSSNADRHETDRRTARLTQSGTLEAASQQLLADIDDYLRMCAAPTDVTDEGPGTNTAGQATGSPSGKPMKVACPHVTERALSSPPRRLMPEHK